MHTCHHQSVIMISNLFVRSGLNFRRSEMFCEFKTLLLMEEIRLTSWYGKSYSIPLFTGLDTFKVVHDFSAINSMNLLFRGSKLHKLLHPWKLTAFEPKNHPTEKGKSSSINLHFFVFNMLIFQGVGACCFKYYLFLPLPVEDEPILTSIFFKGVESTN